MKKPKTYREQEKEREKQKKKNAPINARIRGAKGLTITTPPKTERSMFSKLIAALARGEVVEQDKE